MQFIRCTCWFHDYVYVLGGWSKWNTPSSAAFRCRIEALMKSTTQPNAQNICEILPELPVQEATCTAFRNTLIVVGGRANSIAVHDIGTYNPDSKCWKVIVYLTKPRYICFANWIATQADCPWRKGHHN